MPGRIERKVFTDILLDPQNKVDYLLRNGFRRSQSIAYMPACTACQACVPVRIVVDDFVPGRTFRRTLARNADLTRKRLRPEPTTEQFALFAEYLEARHNDSGMNDMDANDYVSMVSDTSVGTFLTEYRRPNGKLYAVNLSDQLSDGISMNYSFYAPGEPDRGLGTYMILDAVAQAREAGQPYVYLGYWIRDARKMAYKVRFTPQEHLTPAGWVRHTS
jgi:leucyl-tRNA---protein transferase